MVGGGVLAAALIVFMVMKNAAGKDGTATPPVATATADSSGGTTAQPADRLNGPLSVSVPDSLNALENLIRANQSKPIATSVLERTSRLTPTNDTEKVRLAMILYNANLALGEKKAACE